MAAPYIGRFAPSPTGPLHAGSLVAALASWLDARAHGGRWLVRIEDVDTPRCVDGAEQTILAQLAGCGLLPDAPPQRQSSRSAAYGAALDRLAAAGWTYPCGCTRREIDEALGAHERHGERVYPGTCRTGLQGKPPRAIRVRTLQPDGSPTVIAWHDRRLAAQSQDLTRHVGDFVLRRADHLTAYQLAVVVDDAEQAVTHVVRGEDLADNTPRQIHLQRLLDLPTPRYLHTPLVLAADGEKLSKGHGAMAIEAGLAAVRTALAALGIEATGASLDEVLTAATRRWRERWQDTRP